MEHRGGGFIRVVPCVALAHGADSETDGTTTVADVQPTPELTIHADHANQDEHDHHTKPGNHRQNFFVRHLLSPQDVPRPYLWVRSAATTNTDRRAPIAHPRLARDNPVYHVLKSPALTRGPRDASR